MSDRIPPDWVEAAAQAMVDAGMGYGKPVDDRLAAVAITAVTPLIRADEREKVARAIEKAMAPDPHGEGEDCVECDTLRDAAQIARNGGIDE